MRKQYEFGLTGRERTLIRLARDSGYLDATRKDNQNVIRLHGLWCWKLKIPMVWIERLSPRSSYGRIQMDMLTTRNVLTSSGQAQIRALCRARNLSRDSSVSIRDACCNHVPLEIIHELAGRILGIAVRCVTPVRRSGKSAWRRKAAAA